MKLQIGKWGNSLAVRLPREIVDKFKLREGDAIDAAAIESALQALDRASWEERREQAFKELEARRWPLPDNWKFDRDEANER